MATPYILNTPILTDYGVFSFDGPKTVDEIKAILAKSENVVSAVGHQSTANVLSQLLGQDIPMNRIQVSMTPGDKAIVFRLKTRLPEGAVLDEDQLRSLDYELGILHHLS